jgi:CRP/FNR family transcriptional regulator
MSEVIELLRGAPIFADLDQAVLTRLAERCVPRAVGVGFVLFRAGDACGGTYFVLEGRVRVFRTDSDGRHQTLAIEGPGRPVAELPLFDGGPYPASAETVAPSRLIYLPRAEFEYAFRTTPDLAVSVVRALGRRMRHLVQLIETIAFRDVAARLAMQLADHVDHRGTADAEGRMVLLLDRTQEELAAEIGTARESVSRALTQLQRHGLIYNRSGRRLVTVSAEQLRAWARAKHD